VGQDLQQGRLQEEKVQENLNLVGQDLQQDE